MLPEQILKIIAGLASVVAGGAWLNHFFASGEARLNDRRRDKDASLLRIAELEKELRAARRLHAYEVEVKHAALSQLNRISWAYDAVRRLLIAFCETIKGGEAVPTVFIRNCLTTPDAQEVLKDANEVIQGLHIAFSEHEEIKQ